MAAGNDSSRPVLRRTQPKVAPPSMTPPKPLKTPPIAKKPVNVTHSAPSPPAVPPAAVEEDARNSPRIHVKIPVPSSPRILSLSPASVLHDLPACDEDDASSIASSSSHNSSSPCFKKDSTGTAGACPGKPKQVKKKSPKQQMPEIVLPPLRKIASPQELLAQRKLKIGHYGRKQGSPQAVKPAVLPQMQQQQQQSVDGKKRCGWLSSQSDPAYIAYHDEEWGVPVHDDKMLFELLVLAGAQSEMGWSLILSKRESYRRAFEGFDPAAVAAFDKKKVCALKAEVDIFQQDGKLQAVVQNAGRILQIVQEFGSLSNYVWGFVNHKPVVTGFRTSAQVPVKTSKSEVISKDLVKRGFASVGPTTIYSFMQAAGITNDHISQCFRHKECSEIGLASSINNNNNNNNTNNKNKCESGKNFKQQQQLNVFVPVCS